MTAPHYTDDTVTLYAGDCTEVMAGMADQSVDAVVTDPPYGLEFMGKDWDKFKSGRGAAYASGGELAAAPGGSGRSQDKGDYSWFGSAAQRPQYVNRPAKRCALCGKQAWSGSPCTCAEPQWIMDNSPLHAFQAWCQLWAAECLRVLKPGGHLLAFGGTRTHHRLACAIEDAGFEIRDTITWIYATGFPKSLDVSKAIDKAAGVEQEVIGPNPHSSPGRAPGVMGMSGQNPRPIMEARMAGMGIDRMPLTAPATDAARQWQGWGTALKPASEPIVTARKPLSGTVAANVQQWGTGALNIDGCRVGMSETDPLRAWSDTYGATDGYTGGRESHLATFDTRTGSTPAAGRWPPNVVLDGYAAAELDRQSGVTSSVANKGTTDRTGHPDWRMTQGAGYVDSGGSSRFFPVFRYEAKAPASERPKGDDGTPNAGTIGRRRCIVCGKQAVNVRLSSQCQCDAPEWETATSSQSIAHPTVKPLDLMRWLVRLVTPPGGLVLDPFAGSGTTGEACIVEGFRCVLIEKDPDYLPLIVNRLSKPIQPDMFGGAG